MWKICLMELRFYHRTDSNDTDAYSEEEDSTDSDKLNHGQMKTLA